MILSILLAAGAAAEVSQPFPEPTPTLVEACLTKAVATKSVTKTRDSWKYICAGDEAEALWTHLVKIGIEPFDQEASGGIWSSRPFPLGGCFKRVKDLQGNPTDSGLSCTVWIPRQ